MMPWLGNPQAVAVQQQFDNCSIQTRALAMTAYFDETKANLADHMAKSKQFGCVPSCARRVEAMATNDASKLTSQGYHAYRKAWQLPVIHGIVATCVVCVRAAGTWVCWPQRFAQVGVVCCAFGRGCWGWLNGSTGPMCDERPRRQMTR